MVIIGLSGKKYTGKTEIEKFLKEKYKYDSIAFADPIKDTIELWYPGLKREYLYDPELKEKKVEELYGNTPRQIMQRVGDLVRNHFDKDFWVKIVKGKISKLNAKQNIVVSDIRFPNELEMLNELNLSEKVIIFRIIRDDIHREDSHESENQNLNCPNMVTIYNNGSLEELFEKIEKKIL